MRDDGFEARPRAGGVNPRRLTRWQRRDLDRAANDARAAGDRAVQVHGVVRYLWYPEKQPQQAQAQCGQQRTSAAAGGSEGASSAMPAQLSKRKQRSAARLEDFQRQAATAAASVAAAPPAARLMLFSVVRLQRLVRRRLAAVLVLATSTAWEARRQEVATSAAEVEACAAPAAAKDRPDAWSASGEIQVATRRWLARRYVARLRAAVPQLPPPLENGDGAPSAAEAKRRVSFSALVPPSKRALVETGIGAGWLRDMARAPKVDGATNGG